MRRTRALWLVLLTVSLVLLLALMFAVRQQERGTAADRPEHLERG